MFLGGLEMVRPPQPLDIRKFILGRVVSVDKRRFVREVGSSRTIEPKPM